MKKRKRFYNNKKRNQKWTEEEKGRKIEFADKYIENGDSPNKFDSKRTKKVKNRAKRQKRLKNALIAVMCVVLIGVGYTGMDAYMGIKENSYNKKISSSDEESNFKDMQLNFRSFKTDSISLDSSVMLSSVINDTASLGFTSITFDAKRSDGTIGYASLLASVDTFNAQSSPASKPKASIKELLANDLLPIARISCYKDNIAPKYIPDSSVKSGKKKLFKDDEGNTYLNPDSEATYNYLKDIVTELVSMGVNVFVLTDCSLPEEISDKYGDGFDILSKKLYKDIGNNIKLLEEEDVEIKGIDNNSGKITNSAIREEIKNFTEIDKNKVYCISSELENDKLISQLEKSNVSSYIVIS
ncbi:MAG: hypothetical protein IJR70_00325 [Eubacterium sp.]|nr:hypothetical protein [Eubacterium sp.]